MQVSFAAIQARRGSSCRICAQHVTLAHSATSARSKTPLTPAKAQQLEDFWANEYSLD